jgi:putative permease
MSFMRSVSTPARIAYILHILLLIIFLLYFGQGVLIPLAFSMFIAVLILPICNFFERQGFPRLFACLISVILGLLAFVMIAYYLSSQIISFKSDLPAIARNLTGWLYNLQTYVVKNMHLDPANVQNFVDTTTNEIIANTSVFVSTTFLTLGRVIFFVIIIPVYTFLILLYRRLITEFLVTSFQSEHHEVVKDIIQKTRGVVKGYIVGLFIETVIVAVLVCIGFVILGVKYAILLGIFSALLKLIPYLGIVSACLLTMLITITTNSPATVTGSLIVLLVVHIIDGNFLFPAIVGSKVKMNALATIVGVVIGNALWGIAGMFLAIPLLATLKVIFDSVAPFKPWAILLGDDPRIPKMKRGKSREL